MNPVLRVSFSCLSREHEPNLPKRVNGRDLASSVVRLLFMEGYGKTQRVMGRPIILGLELTLNGRPTQCNQTWRLYPLLF